MCNQYSGWSNRATWLVNLWIDNDQGLYETANQCQSADEIKELIEEVIDCLYPASEGSGFIQDLINQSLGQVDWYEIWEARREA